jgi:hypothetical protein
VRALCLLLTFMVLSSCDGSGPLGSAVEPDTNGHQPECLGHPELCSRRYDQVSYFTSHNAMSNEAEGWFVPNHLVPIKEQLQLGVRALMLDIHLHEESLMLCHGTCLAGSEPLVPRLEALRVFLEENPREILTIILESYAPAVTVADAFAEAGLIDLTRTQLADDPWPTLGDLMEANERLVVFTDAASGGPDWMHDVWAHSFETSFSVTLAEQLSCEPNRGAVGNTLFILNHFLSTPFAESLSAQKINPAGPVVDRALECWGVHDQRPNFITVDFATIGDVMGAVQQLNQLSGPTDRTGRQARFR